MTTMVRFTTLFGTWVAPIEHVLAVRPSSVVQSLPAPAKGVAGILDHEGAAVPVLSALGVGRRHVIVLQAGTTIAGLLVDEVTGVVEIASEGVGPAPAGQRTELVEGTVQEQDGLAYVLDVARVVNGTQPMERVS